MFDDDHNLLHVSMYASLIVLFVSPHILLVAPEPYYIWRVRLCWRVQPGRAVGPCPQLPMLHVHWQYAEGKTPLQTVLLYLPLFPWMDRHVKDGF
jgi:hypothetical protein